MRVGVIAARFNEMVTGKLVEGAVEGLKKHGVDEDRIDVAWVPGAFELPLVAKRLARTERYDALICLGAVIRGDTPHFDYVCTEAARGITEASRDTGVPVAFGVLTCDDQQQADDRSGGRVGNKGEEAAEAALEMAGLMRALPRSRH
jgi:6,7-dimethyl-8-ribityllumazine synthase